MGVIVLTAYLSVSIASQIRYTFRPFARSASVIPAMLTKDDLGQLRKLAEPIYQVIAGINQYTEETNFYFVPSFSDSENSAVWWWYLYLLSRYLCYPRKIFCHDEILYGGEKDRYLRQFIGQAARYAELDWVKTRRIEHIILYRNNTVSILPSSAEIKR